MTYKILNNEIDIPHTEMFTYRNTRFFLRGHNFTLDVPKRTNNIVSNFFSNRVVTAWNSLPSPTVNSKTVNEFKSKLKNLYT